MIIKSKALKDGNKGTHKTLKNKHNKKGKSVPPASTV